MSAKAIHVVFHLVGGQTITKLMESEDGSSFEAEDFKDFAETWTQAKNLWLSNKAKWALSVPDMKNVAMVEFLPASPSQSS